MWEWHIEEYLQKETYIGKLVKTSSSLVARSDVEDGRERNINLDHLLNHVSVRKTSQTSGCSFVICPTRQEADKAVNVCHNKRTLPGASSQLQVKYADGELERLDRHFNGVSCRSTFGY
ncbi:hypothetical protein Vadar_033113 [Vaccinium darrowii]|uniref:Uncharacterized protein n=1 Tax=Vaccinium darrowii TaxID=229202 RepID=A0ACB7Z170_9ERIC|nr:hypothetical protein Vadar_033113 [Vaccinium darrowii]